MLNKFRVAITVAFLLAVGIQNIYAQPSRVVIREDGPKTGLANSPLSRIGVGNWLDPSTASIQGMGGIATAYNNPFVINKLNPASYGFTKATTFDINIQAYSNRIFLGNNELNASTYTINNVALAFPMGKYFGLSFGYHPKSTVYYDAAQKDVIPGLDTVNRLYYGYGALHDLYLGAAFKYKKLSIGANVNYLFGNILNSSAIESIYVIDPSFTNAEFYSVNRVKGVQFQLGGMYQYTFKEKYYIHIGAAYDLKAQLNTYQDYYAMQYQYSLSSDGSTITASPVDTISGLTKNNEKGTLVMPSELRLGLHAGKSGFWNVGVDFRSTQWNEFSFNGDRSNIANSTYRMGIGAEITPNPEATENVFLNNIAYRLGAYYGTDYMIFGNQLKYYGGTFSLGLPLLRTYGTRSSGTVNFTFDYGNINNGEPASEVKYTNNYFKFTLGFTLNDLWFQKRKFD